MKPIRTENIYEPSIEDRAEEIKRNEPNVKAEVILKWAEEEFEANHQDYLEMLETELSDKKRASTMPQDESVNEIN